MELKRLGAWSRAVLLPGPASFAGTGRLRAVRRVVGVATVVGTLVQIVVWLMIAVFSGSVDTPWWLFTTVGGVVVAVCLWMVEAYGINTTDDERRKPR